MEIKETIDQQAPQKNTGNIRRKTYLWIIAAFTLAGVISGYAYYAYIGCNGSCPLQSNPYLSMVWGGVLGYLLPGVVLNPKE
jgi:FtsH-binding integral membrane protein